MKTTLAGAFKALKYRKYAQSYLAAFTYRFNRRFVLRSRWAHLIAEVTRTEPLPEKPVTSAFAETRF